MATESSSLNNLMSVYKWVVEDVVKNVKDEFLNESVDVQVLDELKQLWLSKIDLTRHISRPKDPAPPPPTQPSPRKDKPPPLLSVDEVDKAQLPAQTESVIQHAPPRVLVQTPPKLQSQLQPQAPSSTPTQAPSATPTTRTAILLPSPGYAGMLPSGAVAVSNSIPQIAAVRPAQLVSPPAIVMPSQAAAIAGLQQTPQMMVPVQTAQGTVIMPLSQILALQAQQRALAVAKATSQAAAANQSSSPNVDQTDGLPPLSSDGTPPPESSSNEVEIPDSKTWPDASRTLLHSVEEATGKMAASDETSRLCGTWSRTANESSTPVAPGPAEPCVEQDLTSVSIPDCPTPVPNCLELSCKQKPCWRGRPIVQLDGASGGGKGSGKGSKAMKEESSSEEESDDDDTSEEDELEAAGDENPLNSDDDVGDSSEESGEEFETSDTVVCQFEKVYRVKTKWKFQLKDGIMQIGGHDYVFHKAVGEADW